jgi:hypothetical protein
MEKTQSPKYLNEKQVSEMTAIPLSTLRNDRFLSKGIPFIKIGKSVRYDLYDVVDYMDSHKIDIGKPDEFTPESLN